MASTAAERKKKERAEKKAQGMSQKSVWLLPATLEVIEKYKKKHNVTDEEAINQIITALN